MQTRKIYDIFAFYFVSELIEKRDHCCLPYIFPLDLFVVIFGPCPEFDKMVKYILYVCVCLLQINQRGKHKYNCFVRTKNPPTISLF